jgi:hypothetical protein
MFFSVAAAFFRMSGKNFLRNGTIVVTPPEFETFFISKTVEIFEFDSFCVHNVNIVDKL